MTSSIWKKLHSFDTVYSADSVEWCPHAPNQNIFVCGTYQLTENENSGDDARSQNRKGRIFLFTVSEDDILKCLQKIDTAAILDQKWCHCQINGTSLLAIANAVGELVIYELVTSNEVQLSLIATQKVSTEFDDLLCLSLDWSTGKYDSNQPLLAVSDSKGRISCFDFVDNTLILKQWWKAHGFESWICAFNYWNTSILYTGGDDCCLKVFDMRIDSTVFTSRAHSAGVTSLHSNANDEHILVSGSYDEIMHIWDTRNMKTSLSSINLSGGIWRLKWDPFKNNHILAACMYGSFHIIDAKNKSSPAVMADYCEHSSIAYGSDWCHISDQNLIATCSFYDHLLTVSKISLCK